MRFISISFSLLVCALIISAGASAARGFSFEVKKATGDLNNDGLSDLVIVTQDTTATTWPYRLQIFFKEKNGSYKLILSSDKAIDPAFADGRNGYLSGDDFDDITITNGVLTIGVQLLRGYYKHKFRYHNGVFELIGFTEAGSDGHGVCSNIDFNLSTGIRIEKEERCDTDKIISATTKKVMIRPLPDLKNFQPLQSELN